MNSSPTREKNLLDLYFTNNPTLVRQVKMRPGLGDHDSAIMVDSLIKPLVNKSVSRKVYQLHKRNLKDLNYELSEFKVKFLESCDTKSAEEPWKCYHSEMMLLQEKFIPTRVVKPNQSLPWITNNLRKLLKKRHILHKAMKSNPRFKSTYKKFRSEVQRQIRKARWDHINTVVTSDEHGNNKGFWSYVRRFKCDNTGIAVLIKMG